MKAESIRWPLDLPLDADRPPPHAAAWVALERSHRWTPDRMREWQLHRLHAVLEHAHREVPYYRRRGSAPPLRAMDELWSVPVLRQEELRTLPLEERIARPIPPGTQRFTTSGSTGRPAPVLYPPAVRRLLGAHAWRRSVHRRIAPWWRSSRMVSYGVAPTAPPTREGRRLVVPATVDVGRFADAVLELRPHVVSGYPHLLVELAAALPRPMPVRAVTTLGEHLAPATRRALRQSWGVEPMDTYGASEVSAIGWQCRHADLYHLNHEHLLVEIVDDDGRPVAAGEPGDVVVTDLANGLLPHIRYSVGDRAVMATRPCACGHQLPAFARIEGRAMQWLVDASGDRLPPERLWMDSVLSVDEMVGRVTAYTVHQAADRAVTVRIVPQGDLEDGFLRAVEDAYRRALGPSLPVRVAVVDRIERLPSGKFPMVVSDVRTPPPYAPTGG